MAFVIYNECHFLFHIKPHPIKIIFTIFILHKSKMQIRKFLDNAKKRSVNFEYVWIAERLTKNDAFKGNVHFHMITNKY